MTIKRLRSAQRPSMTARHDDRVRDASTGRLRRPLPVVDLVDWYVAQSRTAYGIAAPGPEAILL